MALALVRDLREHRVPASAEELADLETDVLAGFVLARASAGLADSTIRELNRPRAWVDPQLRMPLTQAEVEQLFAGWRSELATCRKFAPAARNDAVARLAADVGLRINEARMLDLDDVR